MGHTTEEGMITIKVAHCGQTKRTTFKKTELTYESLTDWIVSAFGLQAPLNASPARLAYRDPEGDVISIDSSDELSEALRLTPENAILSLHLSFPRPRGERWFARMCAEHAMADEAAAALSPQAPASRFSTGAADATAASSQGDAAGDSSSAAPLDETAAAAAAAAASAQDKAPELGWCERRRAWKAAWKARMAEARASGAFPPGAAGFAFDGPQHHGPHHGPHPHPHHHHGRHGMMGPGPHHGPHHRGGMMGFGGGMGPRPEFCGRPDFHHGPAGRPEFGRPESPSSGASAPENDFGRPEFGRFHHHHPHHHHRAADDEHRPHFPHHPFHHHAPHPHPWTGFGAMPPAYWMMPPCGMPMMPFAHPWAGFSVPAAFAPTASASEPTSPPFHPHAHHHAACATPAAPAPAHDEGHFGGMRRPGFNREECALKRQLNWLLVLTILVVAFHFVPIGVVAVPILGAAAGAVAFCLRRKLRKLKHARGHWAAHHMMSTSSSPSSSPAPAAAPTAAPSAPAAAEASPEAPVRRCHGGRFHHHGRDFVAPFVAPVPAPAAEPVAAPAPVVVAPAEPFHARRCRIQVAPAAPAPVAAVSIVPPVAEVPEAAASPEPLVGHDFRQFRKDLQLLQSMGFTDMHMNRKLLHRLGDVNRVVAFLTDTAQ